MPSKTEAVQVNIRVICLSPPQVTGAVFGLQNKAQNLLPGQPLPDGGVQFVCQLEARRTEGLGRPNWFGDYVHGTPDSRFLYLSLGYKAGDQWHWHKRIKVPLSGIIWEQVQATNTSQGVLQATVDGTRSGTVALVGGGWVVA